MSDRKIIDFNLKKDFLKLSVQYDGHPKFKMNPKILNLYNKKLESKNSK